MLSQASTQSHVTCSPDTGLCLEYDENGNQVCDVVDPGWTTDTDGDLTFDCLDPDDDNDLLTDEYEDFYASLYHQFEWDQDNDNIPDPSDIVTRIANGALMTVIPNKYSGSNDCDVVGEADPYIPSSEFWVKIGSGGQISLAVPSGWQSGDHVDNRATNVVGDLDLESVDPGLMVQGVMGLPDDIFDWPVESVDELPSVTIQIGLLDHDELSDDDRMDLRPGSGTIATIKANLATDGQHLLTSTGDSTGCHGTIGFLFEDNAANRAIQTAVYHRQHPSDLIGLGDV